MKINLQKSALFAALTGAILCVQPAQAQLGQRDGFAFGIKAGANLSQLKGDRYNFSSGGAFIESVNKDQVGAIGGVFLRFGNKFFIQPEAVLSQKGGRFQVLRDNQNTSVQDLNVRFTNLDVPVLVGVRIGEVLRLNLGPVASFNLSDNGNLKTTLDQYSGQNADDVFKTAALGYQVGVGLDFGRLNFDVRYEGNVKKVVDVDLGSANGQFSRKLNLFQATLGFEIL